MNSYEGLFIFPPESTPEARKKQDQSLEDLIRKFEGTIVEKNEWGKRPLGYPIKKFKEGFLVLVDFQLNPLKVGQLRHAFTLQEDFIKFMITRKPAKVTKKASEKSKTPAAKPAQQVAAG
ncbi:MAG TPA: 30S ribosomal protein S6 [bacterium]|nr:30S ribosomal protein S6 [bacterium]